MRVLDLDMDFFLDYPIYNRLDTDERVTDPEHINSVWSEDRVRDFLENNLGLSKNEKKRGRIVRGHEEALFFWDELIKEKLLTSPFSVVHIDSHGDLGFAAKGMGFVLDHVITWPTEVRKPKYCNNFGKEGKIECGNYLLYAVAFRWISDLTYCANPNGKNGDVPEEIVIDKIPDFPFENIYESKIHLKAQDAKNEPYIPFKIVTQIKDVNYRGDFEYVLLAQSPGFTPENADYIIDVFREYIEEI